MGHSIDLVGLFDFLSKMTKLKFLEFDSVFKYTFSKYFSRTSINCLRFCQNSLVALSTVF